MSVNAVPISCIILAGGGSRLCIAEANHNLQLVMLIDKMLCDSIKHSLDAGRLSLMQRARAHQPAIIVFRDESAFRNFNHRQDFIS